MRGVLQSRWDRYAGTIEPGHFRFSVIGEAVLRLEERLGYKHKGVEKRFESMTLDEGANWWGRISCDSTVAYAWAYDGSRKRHWRDATVVVYGCAPYSSSASASGSTCGT